MAELIDPFGRRINYLRLSVTDRCNLRCTYCMAETMQFLPRSQVLSLEEMARLARCFVESGIERIRLTGGEPLIRNGILELTRTLAALPGLKELTMTTNGLLLESFAAPLKAAGLARINISLDSLQPARFRDITRGGDLPSLLRGIDAAIAAGFAHIKLNAVILDGENADEVLALAEFALARGLDISYIEEMPLGKISSHQRAATQFASQGARALLEPHLKLVPSTETTGGPSRYYRSDRGTSRIGFISPISDNFCSSCNRVRLTTEGRLLLCLGNEHSLDLRQLLRQGADDSEIRQAIAQSMSIKPERHHFTPETTQILRFMSATGG